jgi:hypothetical protein
LALTGCLKSGKAALTCGSTSTCVSGAFTTSAKCQASGQITITCDDGSSYTYDASGNVSGKLNSEIQCPAESKSP